jgi:hypothetical protein
MTLRIIGAGLPRTGTASLRVALECLLGGRCCHMSALPGHPFNLGPGWQRAIAGESVNWSSFLSGYTAAVDWPASLFWREMMAANPDAPVILSTRDSAQTWLGSMQATVLPVTRKALAPNWDTNANGRDLVALFERFMNTRRGSLQWDDEAQLIAAYERHNDDVRHSVPRSKLIDWRATDGWAPICSALDLPVPTEPFPWTNRREEWG